MLGHSSDRRAADPRAFAREEPGGRRHGVLARWPEGSCSREGLGVRSGRRLSSQRAPPERGAPVESVARSYSRSEPSPSPSHTDCPAAPKTRRLFQSPARWSGLEDAGSPPPRHSARRSWRRMLWSSIVLDLRPACRIFRRKAWMPVIRNASLSVRVSPILPPVVWECR